MEDVMRQTRKRGRKLQVKYRQLETVEISEYAFADDVVIFAKNEKDQYNL